MTTIFWICLSVIFYTYIGYGILLFLLVKVKRTYLHKSTARDCQEGRTPSCSVLIAAYNEEAFIRQKILNTLSLDYPQGLLNVYIVADGSTDNTIEIIREYPEITLLFSQSRRGKVHAINRAMQFINSEIVVFTDANTFLNKDALKNMCRNYNDPQTGGVAGEKRIFIGREADASTAGENLYWRYESALKRWDSEINTTIGAAGELFSIRRNLYDTVPIKTILDDFLISMRIAKKGYKIVYEPDAYAIETSSSNVKEEYKRKTRIAAGGIQSIIALKSLLNPIKHPMLSFQYISHRVLRWSVTPFLLLVVLLLNGLLLVETSLLVYKILFLTQISFYILAFIGFLLEKKELRLKIAFVPYYFCMMNYSIFVGIFNYLRNEQSSVWDKVERKENLERSLSTIDQE